MSENYSPCTIACEMGLIILTAGLIVISSLRRPIVGVFLLFVIIVCILIILVKKLPEYKRKMKLLKQ